MVPVSGVMPLIISRSGGISGSMPGLCAGRAIWTCLVEIPACLRPASNARMASGGPVTTVFVGLFTATTVTCPAYGPILRSSSCSGSSTEITAAAAAFRSIRCDRATTTRAASSSDSLPATQAAATSPML